jgi:hypothetical protein
MGVSKTNTCQERRAIEKNFIIEDLSEEFSGLVESAKTRPDLREARQGDDVKHITLVCW